MKKLLRLALVGRPNVGKSALFNRIAKKRIAIVDEMEGVTRDRLYAEADFFGHLFEVIDTGGIDPRSKIPFQEEVRRQTEVAIEEADTLVMVVDARVGITGMDEEVAKLLLRTGKSVTLAVNKIDDLSHLSLMHQFYALGISEVVAVSAVQGFQTAELLECAFKEISFEGTALGGDEERIRVAIVGRPNVGKSTLLNYLLKEERSVVSPIAGTTRDSVDVEVEAGGRFFTLIDTAGIRRKRAEHEVVDKFAAIRTERAIERADVCVMMLDAQEGITAQEKRIARHIEEQGKGCILLFNKWDLVSGYRMEHCLRGAREMASFLAHCPAVFVSAKSGRNLGDLFERICGVNGELHRRITTGQLNRFLEQAMQKYHPPMIQGKRLRIYYMAQVDICPPRFVLFVNDPERMCASYQKYLTNQFREVYGFQGVPLFFSLKGRKVKGESLAPSPSVAAFASEES